MDLNGFSCTWFVLALNIKACDWTVAIKTHSPTQGNGPVLHFSDLHFWGVWGLYIPKSDKQIVICYCYFTLIAIDWGLRGFLLVGWCAVIPCTVSCMIPLSSPKELMAWQEKKPESSLTVGMIWWKHRWKMKWGWLKRFRGIQVDCSISDIHMKYKISFIQVIHSLFGS